MVETSDYYYVLWLGCNERSDFNTGGFTENVISIIINFQRFFTKIGEEVYDVGISYVLPKLTEAIESTASLQSCSQVLVPAAPLPQGNGSEITQDWPWNRLSGFLQPGGLP
ncbi:uncharacterized protein N7483_012835 [Penicillium malachiteum]|uniref:uncharacterized protein n=1 Tax=Penicillium malachiteum TaxID=1324776 RepID=UPI002548AED1|nr:uncharacterized protein N7483_012835 [Penicillium malachiteum]KAJ5715654.1 hypothetical protein N7483_012835 [Penicillium malachiteum]